MAISENDALAGVFSRATSRHWGQMRESTFQNTRSFRLSLGTLFLRFSTPSCCGKVSRVPIMGRSVEGTSELNQQFSGG